MEDDSSSTFGAAPNPIGSTHVLSPSENPNSPFFLHHSDNANTVVISPPLTDSNYLSWNRSFTLAISIKNKLGFLDGTIPTPDLSSTLYVSWMRCNNLILSWILNSISKEIDPMFCISVQQKKCGTSSNRDLLNLTM